jgi:hypothetical protein
MRNSARKPGDFRGSAIDAREIGDLNFSVLRRFYGSNPTNQIEASDRALNKRGASS